MAESRAAQLFYDGEKGIFRDRGARTDIGGDCRGALQRPIGLIFFAVSPERIDGRNQCERSRTNVNLMKGLDRHVENI